LRVYIGIGCNCLNIKPRIPAACVSLPIKTRRPINRIVSSGSTEFITNHHVLVKQIKISRRQLLETSSEQVEITEEELLVPGITTEGRAGSPTSSGFITTVKPDITNDRQVSLTVTDRYLDEIS
jgi:hypothetical protein